MTRLPLLHTAHCPPGHGAVAPEVGRDSSRLGRPHPHPHLLTSSPPHHFHLLVITSTVIQKNWFKTNTSTSAHCCRLTALTSCLQILNSVTSCSHKIIKRVNVSWLFCSTLGAVSLQFLCFKSSKSRLQAARYSICHNSASFEIIILKKIIKII